MTHARGFSWDRTTEALLATYAGAATEFAKRSAGGASIDAERSAGGASIGTARLAAGPGLHAGVPA